MYSVSAYGSMIRDTIRMDAYVSALRQAVQPGCTVVDIGTGTGIFALLACQFRAGYVYAIEPSDAIHVAREIAAANGYAERITFQQGMSTDIALPHKADVIISDMRGSLPLLGNHLASIIDARKRFLAPGGTLIPLRDHLFAALVEAPQVYQSITDPWEVNRYSLNMAAARRMVANTFLRHERSKDWRLLTEPTCWATLEYATLASPHVSENLSVPVTQAGTAHGFMVWFDATLADGIGFSNAPDQPELVYGASILPLAQPVSVAVGDTVSLRLKAHLVEEAYVWSWETHVTGPGESSLLKAHFHQSTFDGVPLSLEKLRRRAAHHVPVRNDKARLDQYVLTLMDGSHSLESIATQVMGQFPGQFVSLQEALAAVSRLSVRYSQA